MKLGYNLFRMGSETTANSWSSGDYFGVIVHLLWRYRQFFNRNAHIKMLRDGDPAPPLRKNSPQCPAAPVTHRDPCERKSQSLSFICSTVSPPLPLAHSFTASSLYRKVAIPFQPSSHLPPIFSWHYIFWQHFRCYVFVVVVFYCLSSQYIATRILALVLE